jgi:hypothetical protein
MIEKIKKYIKSLPTISGQKKQIKTLLQENESMQCEIDRQSLEIVGLQDKDLRIAKVKRLELCNKEHLRTIRELRAENKTLREKLS